MQTIDNTFDVKQHHGELLNRNNSETRLFVLDSQNYAARALRILSNTHPPPKKKSLLKSSYPKKYWPHFRSPKNPGIKNFNPKKILRPPPHLKSWIPPSEPKTRPHFFPTKSGCHSYIEQFQKCIIHNFNWEQKFLLKLSQSMSYRILE